MMNYDVKEVVKDGFQRCCQDFPLLFYFPKSKKKRIIVYFRKEAPKLC